MNQPIVNVDLDNVLYDFSGAMKDYAEMVTDRPLPVSTSWNIWEDWGMPKDKWRRLFRRGVEEGYIGRVGALEQGAQDGIWRLHEYGFYIRILTYRLVHYGLHNHVVSGTAQWLEDNAIPYDSLAIVGSEPKSNYVADVLIDDAWHNVRDWSDSHPDALAIVLERPWNSEHEDLPSNVARALTWQDAVDEACAFVTPGRRIR